MPTIVTPEFMRKINPLPCYVAAGVLILISALGAWFNYDKVGDPWESYIGPMTHNTVSWFLATVFVPSAGLLMMVAALLMLNYEHNDTEKIRPKLRRRELERRQLFYEGQRGVYGVSVVGIVAWLEIAMLVPMFTSKNIVFTLLWLAVLLGLLWLHMWVRGQIRLEADAKYKPKSYKTKNLKWGFFYYDPLDGRVTIGDHRDGTSLVNWGNFASKVVGVIIVAVFVWIAYRGITN